MAWYRPDQWHRLLEIADDAEDLEETYEDWRASAEMAIEELSRSGLRPIQKVDVDVEQLLA